jgi:hypothetical protein
MVRLIGTFAILWAMMLLISGFDLLLLRSMRRHESSLIGLAPSLRRALDLFNSLAMTRVVVPDSASRLLAIEDSDRRELGGHRLEKKLFRSQETDGEARGPRPILRLTRRFGRRRGIHRGSHELSDHRYSRKHRGICPRDPEVSVRSSSDPYGGRQGPRTVSIVPADIQGRGRTAHSVHL